MKDHASTMKKLLPNSIVTDRPADLAAYRDIGYRDSMIRTVVRPFDYSDVSTLLAYCNEQGIAVTPWGGGTNLCGALTPSSESIAIDMKSINEITHFSAENSQVTVQAGATIEKLVYYLKPKGFGFCHDPWSWRSSTVGGALALDSAGNLYPKFGSIKDQVLSMKVALADGRIITLGRDLTKSSSSPFLPSLFIGSEGRFGVILEATFTIMKLPESSGTLGFAFSSFSDFYNAICALKDGGVEPQSYIGGTVPSHVEKLQPRTERLMVKLLGIDAALFLYYDGLTEEVEIRRKRASAILGSFGRKMPDKYAREWWENKDTYFEMSPELAEERIYVHVFDLCVPRSNIIELSLKVEEIAEKLGIGDRVSHTLFGAVDAYTVALYVDHDDLGEKVVKQCEKSLIPVVHRYGGSITRTHGLGTLFSDDVNSLEIGEDGLEMLKRIKSVLDPNGIMNPGVLHRRI